MATKGPVPKRSEQRLGHTNYAGQFDNISTGTGAPGQAITWPEPDDEWHVLARDWYRALQMSGQCVYYQQSDVARARYVAHAMSTNLEQGRFSAQLFAAVNAAAAELCDTEGSRRRLRMELERAASENPAEQAAVSNLAAARQRMEKRSG